MSRTLKAAVLGTGFVGRVHMEGIVRTGFVELYGIGEAQIDKARQLAEEYRVPKVTADYRELLADQIGRASCRERV